MGPKHILIIGNYGAGNLGDDAILAGILTDLTAIGHAGRIEVMHGGFESSPEIYKDLIKGLKKVPFVPVGLRSRLNGRSKKEAYSAIKRADLVILGGGGLFVDSESIKAPIIWAAQAKACRKMGKPYICYAQSVGPLKHWLSRFITRRVFKMAAAVHVRDEQSMMILKKMKIKNVHLGSDASLSWLQRRKKAEKPEKPELTEKVGKTGWASKIITVSIRSWDKSTEKTWMPLLAEIKAFAMKKKLKPVLLAMDIRNQDELAQLRAASKSTGLELIEPHSAALAFRHFQNSRLAVTMRLHAGIFAIAAACPFVVISYSTKVAAFMQTLQLKNGFQLLNLENFNKKRFRKALNSVCKTEKLKSNMESRVTQNQAFLAHVLDLH